MKRRVLPVSILSMFLLVVGLFGFGALVRAQESPHQGFWATMEGLQEVPSRATLAGGMGTVLVRFDGQALHYALSVTDLSSEVVMAHIHLAEAGTNGPVVLNICGTPDRPVCGQEGVIASGTAMAENLSGPLAGASLQSLITAMETGRAYYNVHTMKYPGGELRGQLGAAPNLADSPS